MPILSRREFTMLALAPLTGAANAQSGGTVSRMLVGYPPGGTLDTTARHLTDAWRRGGRSYIVDNRVGAAGRIANSQLKRERADGSVLLCTHTSALTIYPYVYSRLMYDADADFMPVSPLVTATCALVISNAVPAPVKSLADYVSWIKSTPDRAMYASPAAGSVSHFLGYQFSEAAGLKLQHVGYRGSAPAMQDLLGGQIPAYFGFVADFLPYMQQGRIRVIAVSGDRRSRFLPSVATFGEQGYPSIRGQETYGIFAPPSTPCAAVEAAAKQVADAGKDKQLLAAFEQVGLEVTTSSPQEFAQRLKQQRSDWGPVVRASGFKSEE